MPKLEILLKDGAIEEFETTPVPDNANLNPSIPKASNQNKALVTGGLLATVGRQAFSTSANLLGEFTSDYAFERKVKGTLQGGALLLGFSVKPFLTLSIKGIEESSNALLRNRAIKRKQIVAQQSAIYYGVSRSKNSRIGGRK